MGSELESVGWVWRERESSGPSINPSCMRTAGRGISERAAGAHVAATRDEKSQNSRQGEHLRAHPRVKTCLSTFPLCIQHLRKRRMKKMKFELFVFSFAKGARSPDYIDKNNLTPLVGLQLRPWRIKKLQLAPFTLLLQKQNSHKEDPTEHQILKQTPLGRLPPQLNQAPSLIRPPICEPVHPASNLSHPDH